MISKHSRFFEAAMKDEWSQTRVVLLPDESPDIFCAYVQWLYCAKLFVKTHDEAGDAVYTRLASLYAPGERLLDDDFQDYILDRMHALVLEINLATGLGTLLCENAIDIIYNQTQMRSPARRFAVDVYLAYGYSQFAERSDEDLSDVEEEFKGSSCCFVCKRAHAGRKGGKVRGTGQWRALHIS